MEYKTSQYQNQKQTQSYVRKKQHYRPNVAINHHEENNNPQWQQKRIPGNDSYQDVVRDSTKTLIIGTIMVKGLNMRELTKFLTNTIAKL